MSTPMHASQTVGDLSLSSSFYLGTASQLLVGPRYDRRPEAITVHTTSVYYRKLARKSAQQID